MTDIGRREADFSSRPMLRITSLMPDSDDCERHAKVDEQAVAIFHQRMSRVGEQPASALRCAGAGRRTRAGSRCGTPVIGEQVAVFLTPRPIFFCVLACRLGY
jgi:hypothetical protein